MAKPSQRATRSSQRTLSTSGEPTAPRLWSERPAARTIAVLFLIAATLALYWPVSGYDFVNFDDPQYLNPHVQIGLTLDGVKWAFTQTEAANWHPLTWLSHMLDAQIFGPKAGGHHLTSLLLHIANSCLLLLLVLRLTRSLPRSFVVAAFFAWHPLHVESVAWVAERKDVLSTFFGLLALLAYTKYVQLPAASSKATRFFILSVTLFALGLMCKPMLVTLPFLLWLLDYWPLARFQFSPRAVQPATNRRLILEKVPFLLLTAIFCAITLRVQQAGHAIVAVKTLPLEFRLGNAALAYWGYLEKLFWPHDLAVFYPYGILQFNWLNWVALAALILVSLGALALCRLGYTVTGWFWYLGALVPVIGLVQVGAQAMADRYMYLPSIGIIVLIVFGGADLAARFHRDRDLAPILAGVALAGCLFTCRLQLGYWQNSDSLYRHAIVCTKGNFVACNNLAVDLEARGQYAEAANWCREAIAAKADYADAHCTLAVILLAQKRPPEARVELEQALQIDPTLPRAHYYLGNQLLAEGNVTAAQSHYQAALERLPEYPEAHYQLAILLAASNPDESVQRFHEALRLKPDWKEALNNLAWVLATTPDDKLRNGAEAVRLAQRAVLITSTNEAGPLDTLAAALAETGKFEEAVETGRKALVLAAKPDSHFPPKEIETHIRCYELKKPIRDPAPAKPHKPSP